MLHVLRISRQSDKIPSIQHWLAPTASIGAGIDSFYEYLAKAYILLGDDEYYRVWSEAYAAVMKYMRSNDGFWVRLRVASSSSHFN